MFFISKIFPKIIPEESSKPCRRVFSDEVKNNKNERESKNLPEFILLLKEKKIKSQESSREETGVYKSAALLSLSDVDVIVGFTACQELLQNLCAFRGILG